MSNIIDYADVVFEQSTRELEFFVEVNFLNTHHAIEKLVSFFTENKIQYKLLSNFYDHFVIFGVCYVWADIQPKTHSEMLYSEKFEDAFGKSKEPEEYNAVYFTKTSWIETQKTKWENFKNNPIEW